MCLTINFSSLYQALKAQPTIATEDMKVYKSLDFRGNKYWAPYRSNFEWKRGQHYYRTDDPNEQALGITRKGSSISISQGLHCCRTRALADFKNGARTVVMIIPKGAKYFEDVQGNMVTDNLIFPAAKTKNNVRKA